jgi:hypothetical protein
MFESIGRALAAYLTRPDPNHQPVATSEPEILLPSLRRGDVLLVEGNSRVSTAIKYLTQSTWSHSALYIGEAMPPGHTGSPLPSLLEADMRDGVRLIALEHYARFHTRICRPVGLNAADIDALIDYAKARVGQQYDLKNIVDLVRYLVPTPPVPQRWRRRMIALGSGDPTQAICSSLIARTFQSVRYPILPIVEETQHGEPVKTRRGDEVLHIRHHSLFTPRDFDVSPYFQIVKPRLAGGFDPYALTWAETAD